MVDAAEYRDYFESNAQTLRFLSQALFKELTPEAIAQLEDAQWPDGTGNENLDAGYGLIRRYFAFKTSDRREQLAVEYARIFLAAGVYTKEVRTAVPYESVFTSEEHEMMGESRDDVVARFLEDGFAVNPDLHEPEDHLSFELEYLQVMCERAAEFLRIGDDEGLRANAARQSEFIRGHVLNWLPLLAEVAGEYATLPFYPGLLQVAQGTLEQQLEVLDELA